ncbi:recombination mediator RecR [Arcanobacterium bovis]|uniref:Recombination protein RecR n=1 Tax=Arcanobacterium bovis TaxID=2529275 RepID=A0A4Q9V2J8_9ACTO|nr:recombination mediator RecR [Arcanobacterium bovis]TBW23840.1 recombination protein RecR [Arcanobacterium bovis]
MAGVYDGAVQELIDELGRLPGVGPKGAQRIAFHLLEVDDSEVQALVEALQAVKLKVKFCTICGNVTETDVCRICSDPRRLDSVICVVEESRDIVAIERAREYRGRYHVLGGAIDPIGGVGPENLRIRELYARLASGEVKEVILAMDPNVEGEATATYLSLNLSHMGVVVSRLASGLPVGGDLEYADEITISRALEGRQRLHTPMSELDS